MYCIEFSRINPEMKDCAIPFLREAKWIFNKCRTSKTKCFQNINVKDFPELIQLHARANYTKGWDVIVECWENSEIENELAKQNITNLSEAIEYFQKYVELKADYASNFKECF